MKLQIRSNVFESNSSSMHSFTYCNTNMTNNNLVVDQYDNCVHTDLGEFGWEVRTYYDTAAKLAYILVAAASLTENSMWYYSKNEFEKTLQSFKETDEYQRIEEAVKLRMNCDGIVINDRSEGYIDHQSLEYSSFDEWLSDTGADSVDEFIFGSIIIHTDNDNH